MKRSKKIFLVISAIFITVMLIIAYDISQRTSFPGSKKELNRNEPGITDSLDQATKKAGQN
jgi:hypothetical protein